MLNITTDNDKAFGTRRVPAEGPEYYATKDLIFIYKSNFYINEKGYLQKLVELLYDLGYYNNNKTLFTKEREY